MPPEVYVYGLPDASGAVGYSAGRCRISATSSALPASPSMLSGGRSGRPGR